MLYMIIHITFDISNILLLYRNTSTITGFCITDMTSQQSKVTNTRKCDDITPILQKLHWLPVRQGIHFKILLITSNPLMIWRQNTCVNWCLLESHPENLGHPVIYYCRFLGWSHMLIVRLVLEPPLCRIGCQHILEMRHLLKILNLF